MTLQSGAFYLQGECCAVFEIFRSSSKVPMHAMTSKPCVTIRGSAILCNMQTHRRPLIAYRVAHLIPSKYTAYSDAYGLEMTYDADWQIDAVVFSRPRLLRHIEQETGLTAQDSVSLGIASPRRAWHNAPTATWQFIDRGRFPRFWKTSSSIRSLVTIRRPDHIRTVLSRTDSSHHTTLTFAFILKGEPNRTAIADATVQCREILDAATLTETRVLIAARGDEKRLASLLDIPSVDGIFHYGSRFAEMTALMEAAGARHAQGASH